MSCSKYPVVEATTTNVCPKIVPCVVAVQFTQSTINQPKVQSILDPSSILVGVGVGPPHMAMSPRPSVARLVAISVRRLTSVYGGGH